MIPLLDDYLRVKNLRDCWISSRDIDDQRIMKSDWTRSTNAHNQPKVVASSATNAKNLRDRLSPSREIDHQRILQSDWLRAY